MPSPHIGSYYVYHLLTLSSQEPKLSQNVPWTIYNAVLHLDFKEHWQVDLADKLDNYSEPSEDLSRQSMTGLEPARLGGLLQDPETKFC